MTDSEWMALRVRRLMLNNIFIPDVDRPLYDASASPPEPRSAAQLQPATPEPEHVPGAQEGALRAKGGNLTKPQPVDLSEFLGGS